MKDKLDRMKLQSRDKFTEEEKIDIWKKTDGVCAHCGNELFLLAPGQTKDEHLFTVDHFVPLSRGGANRIHNLIPLCKKCNDDKTIDVRNPDEYIKYMRDDYRKEITGLYDSYLMSFDYVNRNNLLANDVYEYDMPKVLTYEYLAKKSHRKKGYGGKSRKEVATFKYLVHKAHYDDLDKIFDYYVKYLDKYDMLESKEAAKDNISYWFTYGTIHCAYKKDGSLSFFVVSTCSDTGERVRIIPFFYYVNQKSTILVTDVIHQLSFQIAIEQGLPYMPVEVLSVITDPLLSHTPLCEDMLPCEYDPRFINVYFYAINPGFDDILELKRTSGKTADLDAYAVEKGYDVEVDAFFKRMKQAKADIMDYLHVKDGRPI